MIAEYQNRDGLYPEMEKVAPITRQQIRLTIPAKEALQRHGHTVTKTSNEYYTVVLTPEETLPGNLVAVHINTKHGQGFMRDVGLRLQTEPQYPGEYRNSSWELAEWLPCPVCGAPIIWYEAGYVPGYRICGKPPHHHIMLKEET